MSDGVTYKLLTWNIRNGGGRNCRAIADALAAYQADTIVLTEYRSRNDKPLREGLHRAGYESIIAAQPAHDQENAVLVASRGSAQVLPDISFSQDPQRGLGLHLPSVNLTILAVYIPGTDDHKFSNGFGMSGRHRKMLFWDEVLEHAQRRRDERTLIVGDFNTGLPEDAEGVPFHLQDKMRALLALGYTDVWRHCNGDARDYTWYSQQKIDGVTRDKNGFRLDYIFVSPALQNTIKGATHSHKERREKLSDHAILIGEFLL